MQIKKIPVAGPSITDEEIKHVLNAVKNGWYDNANYYHSLFEKKFAKHIGVKHAIFLPSCTSAIHLALASQDIKIGDEVIIPDITWIASAAPIYYCKATPIFVDIDPLSWCIDVSALKRAITSKTRAIIAVDLYGNMPSYDEIEKIAKENNLFLIEDAAEAIGSQYKGKRAGSFGDVGVFSFHGSKTLTTGEGGMLVTQRDDVYERALFLRDHGRSPKDVSFFNRQVAFKYKASSMQAALGYGQLNRIEELVEKKRELFFLYQKYLEPFSDYLSLNTTAGEVFNSFWMVTAIFNRKKKIEKEKIIEKMNRKNISCRPFFYPLSSLPAYSELQDANYNIQNKVSYEISPYGINLPSALSLQEEDIKYVCSTLMNIVKSF